MRSLDDIIASRTKAFVPKKQAEQPMFDSTEDDASTLVYGDQDLRLATAATILEWIETDDSDLDAGETIADRLLAMLIGIADENQDGELDDDELLVLDDCMEFSWDYLSEKGVSDADIEALLSEGDVDAAARVQELLKNTVADGDAALTDMDDFAFAEAVMDATYKKKLAIRGGRKVRINKRVAGRVVLTGKQKMAIRKARMKSHSAAARVRRAKSMRIRSKTISK